MLNVSLAICCILFLLFSIYFICENKVSISKSEKNEQKPSNNIYPNKINKYDYEFNIDIEKTRLMYSDRPNSLIIVDKQLPELISFLDDLGIDIRKPDKYDLDFSDVIYTFIGSATSKDGYEIDMCGEEQYISIVVYDDKDGITKLEVFGINE